MNGRQADWVPLFLKSATKGFFHPSMNPASHWMALGKGQEKRTIIAVSPLSIVLKAVDRNPFRIKFATKKKKKNSRIKSNAQQKTLRELRGHLLDISIPPGTKYCALSISVTLEEKFFRLTSDNRSLVNHLFPTILNLSPGWKSISAICHRPWPGRSTVNGDAHRKIDFQLNCFFMGRQIGKGTGIFSVAQNMFRTAGTVSSPTSHRAASHCMLFVWSASFYD